MSALWSGWGADAFTEQVEKATSELLPAGSEDIALNLDICDQVRAKQVQPKQAMQVIKRRIGHKNPNVVLLALGLTDICIKNGGDHFLQEVASREFMDNLVSVLKSPTGVNHDVKNKALGLIQNWAQIAEAKPAMSYIIDIYKQLKNDDKFDFPPPDPNAVASAALVETLTAPEWIDGEVCMRCRTAFTTFNRKHHCRNCGNVFCQQCSTHTMSLPWFGIGQDVRVCDGCFAKKGPPKNAAKLSRSKSGGSSSNSTKYVPAGRGGSASQRSVTAGGKSKRRQKEEEELALAIKLSLDASGGSSRPEATSAPSQPPVARSSERQSNGRMMEGTDADNDPDLAAAIAASLRDWAPPQPSAPDGLSDGPATASGAPIGTSSYDAARSDLPLPPSLDLAPHDIDHVLTFSQTVRAQQAHNQRHGIMNAPPDQHAHALFEKASSARPRIARNLDEGYRRHDVLVSMHDKLTEAVKLYDRLLDAQMARPVHQYSAHPGYAGGPQDQAYRYGYEQAPASQPSGYGGPAASGLYPHVPQNGAPPMTHGYGAPPEHAQHYGQQSYPSQGLHQAERIPSGTYQENQYAQPVGSNYAQEPYVEASPDTQGMQGQMQRSLYNHVQPRTNDHYQSGPGYADQTRALSQGAAYYAGHAAPLSPGSMNRMQPHVAAVGGEEAVTNGYASTEPSAPSTAGGWSTVPIQAVPPSGDVQHQQQAAQPQSPSNRLQPSGPIAVEERHVKSDTSRLPLFPIAPHADNGFGNDSKQNLAIGTLSPSTSIHTNAPSSAEMWQSSKSAHDSSAAQEAPLIEF